MELFIKPLEHGSSDYAAEIALRDAVLRGPLGLSFSAEDLAGETDSFHLGCFLEKGLVGCLVLKPLNSDEIQMRQVAVDPEIQGRGIGKAIVKYSEEFARNREFKRMVMHARTTAVPFYERLNYKIQGDEFIEVTIPHFKMYKDL